MSRVWLSPNDVPAEAVLEWRDHGAGRRWLATWRRGLSRVPIIWREYRERRRLRWQYREAMARQWAVVFEHQRRRVRR